MATVTAAQRSEAYRNLALVCSRKFVEAIRADMFPDAETEKIFGILMNDSTSNGLGDLIYRAWTEIYKRRLFYGGETVYDSPPGPASRRFCSELADAVTSNRLAPSFREWVREVVDDDNFPMGVYCRDIQSRNLNLDFVIHPTNNEHRQWMERFQTELGGAAATASARSVPRPAVSSDFVGTATPEEMERAENFWANARKRSNEFARSAGEVVGGRWVKITGLQSKEGKKLNGKIAQVLKEELNQDGRYPVKVDGIRDGKLIKPANLLNIPAKSLVKTFRASCDGERSNNQVILFPREHSMFQAAPAEGNAPAMARTGVPIMVKKTKPKTELVERGDYDNQHATWMMIDPVSGFAPMEWQSYVGPVLVYRPGGQDFGADDYDVTTEFLSDLLDQFGEGPEFDPSTWLNPTFFQNYIQNLVRERAKRWYGSSLENLNILVGNEDPTGSQLN